MYHSMYFKRVLVLTYLLEHVPTVIYDLRSYFRWSSCKKCWIPVVNENCRNHKHNLLLPVSVFK